MRIRRVAAAIRPLAQIVALRFVQAGQNDVREGRLAAKPAVLHHDELEIRALVHLDPLIGIHHGTHEGAAVAVEHLDRGLARHGKDVVNELLLQCSAAETIAPELFYLVDDGLGKGQAEEPLFGLVLKAKLLFGDRRPAHLSARFGVAREPEAVCSAGAPMVVPQILMPGLPSPCMAISSTIMRAHSVAYAARQALPSPPRAPQPIMVRLTAHSRASERILRAGIPDSFSAHSGVLGNLSSTSPRM